MFGGIWYVGIGGRFRGPFLGGIALNRRREQESVAYIQFFVYIL